MLTFMLLLPTIRRGFIEKFLDLLLPPLCIGCEQQIETNQALCGDCWKQIHFIDAPWCASCGAPFEVVVEDGTLCGACIAYPPQFAVARAALLYNDASKHLILRFKHADKLHPAAGFAAWMLRVGRDLIDDNTVIIPVPLHRWRLFKRRYNQSAVLATEIGRQAGLPVWPDALLRKRATDSQGHKNREQRLRNVSGAFAVNPRHLNALAGKTILLIDDVFTTGATVSTCAKTLNKAGVKKVHVLTLARTRLAN